MVDQRRGDQLTVDKRSGFVHWTDVRNEFITQEEQVKNDVFAKIIGSLIMRRKHLKITQGQLAERIGITQANLARIETGDAIPKLDTFYKLILGLDLKIVLVPNDSNDKTEEEQAAAKEYSFL